MWGAILKTEGVRFVNVQYGDCADELARAAKRHGVEIVNFEDLDLKNDIDGAAALSAALDLVISAPTAAAADCGERRHRDLVPHRGPHLAAARHRPISLVSGGAGVQPGEIRRLAGAAPDSGRRTRPLRHRRTRRLEQRAGKWGE